MSIKKNIEKFLTPPTINKIRNILLAVLILVLLVNFSFIFQLTDAVNNKIAEAEAKAKPASIELLVINDPGCNDCFNINQIIDLIKTGNVKVKKEEILLSTAAKAQATIKKYNIQKIPTLLVFGDINQPEKIAGNLEKNNDALIFTKQTPPYIDAATLNVVGRVSATLITDESCQECSNITSLIDQLKLMGVKFGDMKIVKLGDASDLIKKYNIKIVPSLILSPDALLYEIINQNWNELGTIEEDKSLVMREIPPPFKDLETNKIKGLVKLTMITDQSCTACYNVIAHKRIMEGMGLKISQEETVDIASEEGKKLVRTYNITGVPTIILSKDALVYGNFKDVWQQVGSEETDSLVFRDVKIMGKYKDLSTGQEIEG